MNFVGVAVRAVARRWGVSEGQAYTALIGVVLALAAAVGGIPPTLAERRVETTGTPRTARTTPDVVAVGDSGSVAGLPDLTLVPAIPLGDGLGGPEISLRPPPSSPPGGPARDPVGSFRVLATIPEPGAPQGIAAAPNGRVIVATDNGPERGVNGKPALFVFDGGDAPKRITLDAVVAGQGVHDLVLAPGGDGGDVYALASRPAAVLHVDLNTGSVSTYAAVPDIPPCARAVLQTPCELSPVDNAPKPIDAIADDNGTMFVADAAQGVVWRIGTDRVATLFFQAREFVALDGLSGIAAAPDRVLYLTVARAPTAAGAGVIYRLADGKLAEVVRTDNGDLPRGVVAGRSGKLYVALSGSGRVLVLNRDGSRVGWLPGAQSAFDTPVRVMFGPTALLVVEQAPTRPQAGRVVALGVDDSA